VSPIRWTTRALLPLALHGLAREIDSVVGTMLKTSLDLPGLVPEALSLLEPGDTLVRVLAWVALGSVVWALLALERARREGGSFREALGSESGTFGPLYLRPALTLLALVSLALVPTFPYGFTLPVALTQDLGLAQDVAAVAALVALRAPAIRLPAPASGSVFFLAFLAYSFLAPGWARLWDAHPGNQPKTLRMAVSLSHELSLDAEGVSAPMEQLTPRPFLPAAADAASTLARESALLARASMGGVETIGAGAIRASRITRQTIRGKNGGVYYVLPPGPSALLAPALRLDRALNLARGTPGRLDVTLLLWNALAAALVAAVFALARDASGRPGLAALVAAGFGLAPPFVFYSYQFYPEMLGALVLALVFRWLFFVPRWTPAGWLLLGGLLATLPWLHQKFLPVWGVLVLTAVILAVHRLVTFRALLALLLPQLATLYLLALYNFAITGSARPDAMYLAWGPQGVTAARIPEGLLGLLLDARFGILPYVPVYVVAVAGLMLPGRGAARLRLALPGMAIYYVTVASADNWSGAVCNLGRYFMPLTPLLAAAVAVALARLGSRRGILALTLILAAWTGLWSLELWRDLHAADDCALLLAKSTFADGHVYIPNRLVPACRRRSSRGLPEPGPGRPERGVALAGPDPRALALPLQRAPLPGSPGSRVGHDALRRERCPLARRDRPLLRRRGPFVHPVPHAPDQATWPSSRYARSRDGAESRRPCTTCAYR